MSLIRIRWAALGAAVAITLGAGGIGLVGATSSSGSRDVYTAIASCRVADTRPAFTVGGRTAPLGPGDIHTIKVTGTNGQCTGIPTDVTAVALNVTALGATQLTHLTIWPSGPVPNASSLNPAPGQPPVPNAVTTKIAGDGTFKVFNNSGSVHVIVDIVGYFRNHNHDDRYYTKAQADANKPTASFSGGNSSVEVLPTATVVRSASIVAPSAGTIIANGAVTAAGLYDTQIQCSLGTTAAFESAASQYTALVPGGVFLFAQVSTVRHFAVSAGTHTVHLVCIATGDGSAAGPWASPTQLSLLFVPN